MNLFLEQPCDVVLFWSVPNCYAIATQEYLLFKYFCKYLITSDLRLGSSVGRAEDLKSSCRRFDSAPSHLFDWRALTQTQFAERAPCDVDNRLIRISA